MEVMQAYFKMGHQEQVHVPLEEVGSPRMEVYYLPMHTVHKEDSTTSKLCVVFDASAKTASGTSLNNHLLVGPTVQPQLVDVPLRLRKFKVGLITDVSRMYWAVQFPDNQKDLICFFLGKIQSKQLQEYRMIRLTFDVSASSFVENMALMQNTLSHRTSTPKF